MMLRFGWQVLDSHCHIRADSPRSVPSSSPSVQTVASPRPAGAALCGTHPALDWSLLEQWLQSEAEEKFDPVSPKSWFVGFGVHPWFVFGPTARHQQQRTRCCGEEEETSQVVDGSSASIEPSTSPSSCHSPQEMMHPLEAKLQQYPQAFVGEIGLDKFKPPPPTASVAIPQSWSQWCAAELAAVSAIGGPHKSTSSANRPTGSSQGRSDQRQSYNHHLTSTISHWQTCRLPFFVDKCFSQFNIAVLSVCTLSQAASLRFYRCCISFLCYRLR